MVELYSWKLIFLMFRVSREEEVIFIDEFKYLRLSREGEFICIGVG